MTKLFCIRRKDGQYFAGWQKYQSKQGKFAVFSDKTAKAYDEDLPDDWDNSKADLHFDISQLQKLKHKVDAVKYQEATIEWAAKRSGVLIQSSKDKLD